MNFVNINIKYQKVLVILVCSIIIGTGVSVFGYLKDNDAKESFRMYLINECENLALLAQKHASKETSGFIDWKLPASSEKIHSIYHKIIKIDPDSLIILSTPKVTQKSFTAVETLITRNQIITRVIE